MVGVAGAMSINATGNADWTARMTSGMSGCVEATPSCRMIGMFVGGGFENRRSEQLSNY